MSTAIVVGADRSVSRKPSSRFLGGALRFMIACTALVLGSSAAAQTTLRVAYVTALDSHFGDGVSGFAAEVERASRGRIKVEHLAAYKGAGELEIIDKVRTGELEMGNVTTAALAASVPDVRVFDLPFLFHNYGHARRTLDGPIGQRILERFEVVDLVGLAWTENGFRHITNNKRPIVFPDDLAAVRLRTMENPVHVAAFKALKVEPMPMAFPRLFEALKANQVDGQENPLPVILSSKIYEQQRYFSLTQHLYSAAALVVSKALWDKLTPADRQILVAAAQKGAHRQRNRVNTEELRALEQLRNVGVAVNLYVDGAAFRRMMRPRYAELFPGADKEVLLAIMNGS